MSARFFQFKKVPGLLLKPHQRLRALRYFKQVLTIPIKQKPRKYVVYGVLINFDTQFSGEGGIGTFLLTVGKLTSYNLKYLLLSKLLSKVCKCFNRFLKIIIRIKWRKCKFSWEDIAKISFLN
ncbi:hypothetical protein DYU05_06355 [Mucilaginibacter terrenus]|uniref:Uncharacterized protein n=1 Tax=Mucilaginibacter terrenus TaxID=2482727 RepID=A0A3E2NWI3_9SPHI|nr:hypothetical protein DYU05_06355 [Mucilaginibacter terrenus]